MNFQVGYFPSSCVTLFGGISTEKLNNNNGNELSNNTSNKQQTIKITTKSIIRRKSGYISSKFGKGEAPKFQLWQNEQKNPLIKSLFSVFTSDSSTSTTKKVFGLDLEQHLKNSGREGQFFKN